MTDPRIEVAFREFWPFEVTVESASKPMYQKLVSHLEYMATGGKGMGRNQLADLADFYRQLRAGDRVVVFDGADWRLEPREVTDLDLIVRPNEHTIIGDFSGATRMMWRYPPREIAL